MLAFFGNHFLGRQDHCVYSGSIIDVLSRAGVGEQAVRSTLTRMVNRGLLWRQREGRKMYFGLTPHAARILQEGERRIWKDGAVNEDWDGTWTLLGFSLPDSWQRQRHELRSKLVWFGFGTLYGGLWIAPGKTDVSTTVAELGLTDHVKIFHGEADTATDIDRMIMESWDLDGIAVRYTSFHERWSTRTDTGADPLGIRLRLVTEWLQVIRTDPRLPARHLPASWPAQQAQETFRRVAAQTEASARRMADTILDTMPVRPDAQGR
ncbi:PaaX family transcriptional regulator [Streptomyces sp. GC420]|nr:PaaX family transcriptional regulator [Streptomyces sp. GC420]